MKKLSVNVENKFWLFFSGWPIRLQLWLGDVIGFLWFDVLRIRRHVALQNMQMCFPDWPQKRRIQIARASVCNLGRSFIEFLRIPSITHSDSQRMKWKSQFQIEGEEHLKNALDKSRGVFLLTAHIGNGDWGAVGLALHGYKLHIISKEFKFKWLNRFWFGIRSGLGAEFIADRRSSLSILKFLKKNQIVVFMLDQFMGPPIGVKTRFFGYETGTAMGLALLTARSGAAVVPTYTHRKQDGTTVVTFEAEIPFVELANKDETIQVMTQKYCDKIEQWVRAYPEQWMWVHRRWKKYKY